MRPVSPLLTYIGIAITAIGFGVVMFAWGEVAGLTQVALQMPYLLSGGLVGIGLILTGLTLVNVNAKRQDAANRERQLAQVREVLGEIRGLLAGDPPVGTPQEHADHTEPLASSTGGQAL